MMTSEAASLRRRIRWLLAFFIAGLALSGITAFPLDTELNFLVAMRGGDGIWTAPHGSIDWWILNVRNGLGVMYRDYGWIAYGTDWLGFGHLVIALFFVGPWRDPVRNAWVLRIGLVACAGVFAVAMIAGPIRGIPFYWRLIDCSFGVIGAIPLLIALRWTRLLEAAEQG